MHRSLFPGVGEYDCIMWKNFGVCAKNGLRWCHWSQCWLGLRATIMKMKKKNICGLLLLISEARGYTDQHPTQVAGGWVLKFRVLLK